MKNEKKRKYSTHRGLIYWLGKIQSMTTCPLQGTHGEHGFSAALPCSYLYSLLTLLLQTLPNLALPCSIWLNLRETGSRASIRESFRLRVTQTSPCPVLLEEPLIACQTADVLCSRGAQFRMYSVPGPGWVLVWHFSASSKKILVDKWWKVVKIKFMFDSGVTS